MKKLLLLATLFFTVGSFAQSFSGKAYYQSKTTVDTDQFGGAQMSEDMKKQIMERMKGFLEKTFILTFNGDESIYKEQEKLEAGAGLGRMGAMMGSFSAGAQYKNLKTNQILEEREFFGKKFLINDTITNLQWEVGKESRQIGEYLAIKATAVKMVDPNDFAMARPRGRRGERNRDSEKEDLEKVVDSTQTESDDPFDQIEIPKEVIVTAWFTPQIPVANGPGEFAGLPGLILELNVERTTILCSKITLKTQGSESIEAPDKGDEVSREEYNKIIKVKMEEMREQFRGSGSRSNGRGRFGGF
jgi:GLPGLI family protein